MAALIDGKREHIDRIKSLAEFNWPSFALYASTSTRSTSISNYLIDRALDQIKADKYSGLRYFMSYQPSFYCNIIF